MVRGGSWQSNELSSLHMCSNAPTKALCSHIVVLLQANEHSERFTPEVGMSLRPILHLNLKEGHAMQPADDAAAELGTARPKVPDRGHAK